MTLPREQVLLPRNRVLSACSEVTGQTVLSMTDETVTPKTSLLPNGMFLSLFNLTAENQLKNNTVVLNHFLKPHRILFVLVLRMILEIYILSYFGP